MLQNIYTDRIFRLIFVMFSLAAMLSACQSNPQAKTEGSSAASQPEKKDKLAAWSSLINGDVGDLNQVYIEEPVLMNTTGPITVPPLVYLQDLQRQYGKITNIYTTERVLAREERGYHYEIGGFTTASQQAFKHLLILKQQGDTLRRELEFIAKSTPVDTSILTTIDQRRAEWMALCNAHNAAQLVKNLYRTDAMYYNHKPLLIGHVAIAQDYGYMNREQYSLKLTPIIVEPVNDQLVYEIGQCSGSYGGKYMLIWKKDAAGQWSLLMDSNI